jgi:hypothetical protein
MITTVTNQAPTGGVKLDTDGIVQSQLGKASCFLAKPGPFPKTLVTDKQPFPMSGSYCRFAWIFFSMARNF